MLHAAAVIVAARLQAKPAGANEGVSQMLLQAMTDVLGGIVLMEDHAKGESMDLWERLAD